VAPGDHGGSGQAVQGPLLTPMHGMGPCWPMHGHGDSGLMGWKRAFKRALTQTCMRAGAYACTQGHAHVHVTNPHGAHGALMTEYRMACRRNPCLDAMVLRLCTQTQSTLALFLLF
jgi:hypothetical protein